MAISTVTVTVVGTAIDLPDDVTAAQLRAAFTAGHDRRVVAWYIAPDAAHPRPVHVAGPVRIHAAVPRPDALWRITFPPRPGVTPGTVPRFDPNNTAGITRADV